MLTPRPPTQVRRQELAAQWDCTSNAAGVHCGNQLTDGPQRVTPGELKKLISNHEDNFVERKSEGVTPQELRQTVSAFANTVPEGRKAVLFIGIHDKTGEVVGVTSPDRVQGRVREACHEDCYPRITYVSEVISVDGKRVVAVVVPFSTKKPHFTGPAYIRAGSASVKASEE